MPEKPVYVLPEPLSVEFAGESVDLRRGWRLVCESEAAAGLAGDYARILGVPLAEPAGAARPLRLVDADLPHEAYRLEMSREGGIVEAGGESGFRYALQSLRQMVAAGSLPVCRMEDRPQLGMRGFHAMLRNHQANAGSVRRWIQMAAQFKLNTLILEYDGRFPYQRHGQVCAPNAFTPEEVAGLVAHAHAHGLEVIPLQQSLGHVEYLLRHDAYAGLREDPEYHAQMCPANPRSFETFVELAEEMLAAHPGARFFHVGGDETRRLGFCPRCREHARRAGLGGVYGEHMAKVLNWVIERGLRPIIWDDMLCAHPEALPYIPRETVIMYWEYWTVRDPSPYFVARFDRKGRPAIVHDARWGSEWPLTELSDTQRGVLEFFSSGVPLGENLGDAFLERYRPYLGPDFPRLLRAFPYLEYYQDQGFDVIAGPTMMGNHEMPFGLPNLERFFYNIHAYAERCRGNGKSLGLVTTSWYSFPPELLHQGLVATGQFTWSTR